MIGEGGIINQAETARQHQANAEASDLALIDNLDEQIAKAMAEPPVPSTPAGTSATKPETWTNTQVSAIADGTTNAYGKPQNTGYSEYWSANNIYDLAGNYYDWTQEAYDNNSRIGRGRYLLPFRF